GCAIFLHNLNASKYIRDMSLRSGGVGGGMMNEAIEHAVSVAAGNDPATWVDEHGDVLYRYALARVRKPDVAQDLVQETFLATVFMMREMDEIESKEICATLSISDSNLWVMLHRARMALRECLAANWFENPEVQH